MQDLSDQVYAKQGGPVGALCPSSQHAGNRPSDLTSALTAPGSPSQSVDEQYGSTGHGDMVSAPPYTASNKTSPEVHNPEDRTPIPVPYPKTSGPRWVRAGDVKTEGMNDYG